MDLLLVTALVMFFLEILDWPWQSRRQKYIVAVMLIISFYLFWQGLNT